MFLYLAYFCLLSINREILLLYMNNENIFHDVCNDDFGKVSILLKALEHWALAL